MSQFKSISSPQQRSVLPDNQGYLERALELSFESALYSVKSPYPNLLDAQTTAASTVPYLAAEKQLGIWSSTDSEAVKRTLTATAWKVRCLSGTKGGIKVALKALDFDSELTAWHQQTPKKPPYHLDVLAWGKGNKPVNLANIEKLLAYIKDTKSERDVIDLSLIYGVETSFSIAGATSPPAIIKESKNTAVLWPMPVATAFAAVAGVSQPAINVQPVASVAIIPTAYCYSEIFTTAHASYGGTTVAAIKAQAEIG